MKKIRWKVKTSWGRRKTWEASYAAKGLYGFYKTDYTAKAVLFTRNSGPNTVYAIVSVYFTTAFTCYKHVMTRMSKHFKGKGCWILARKWCEFNMKYPPNYVEREWVKKDDS